MRKAHESSLVGAYDPDKPNLEEPQDCWLSLSSLKEYSSQDLRILGIRRAQSAVATQMQRKHDESTALRKGTKETMRRNIEKNYGLFLRCKSYLIRSLS